MWHSAKGIIKSTSGLNDIVLHVLLGAAIFIVLAIALRRPLLAFLLTTIIQIANELVDLIEDATGTGVAGSLAGNRRGRLPRRYRLDDDHPGRASRHLGAEVAVPTAHS